MFKTFPEKMELGTLGQKYQRSLINHIFNGDARHARHPIFVELRRKLKPHVVSCRATVELKLKKNNVKRPGRN